MNHLPTVTRLAIPAAMVSFLTIEIGKSQHVVGWLVYLIYGAAFCTAVGIELWGIIAGNNLDKSWRIGHGRAWSVIQMAVYVVIGGWLLRHNLTVIMLPLVAALAYVATGFAESLETAVNRQDEELAVSSSFDREQDALDRELERRMAVAKIRLAHEEKLARIEAKKATSSRREVQPDRQTITDTSKTDWRTLTQTERLRILDFTPDEIAKRHNVSRKTADRWLDRAGKLSASVSSNGHL